MILLDLPIVLLEQICKPLVNIQDIISVSSSCTQLQYSLRNKLDLIHDVNPCKYTRDNCNVSELNNIKSQPLIKTFVDDYDNIIATKDYVFIIYGSQHIENNKYILRSNWCISTLDKTGKRIERPFVTFDNDKKVFDKFPEVHIIDIIRIMCVRMKTITSEDTSCIMVNTKPIKQSHIYDLYNNILKLDFEEQLYSC